MGCKHPFGLDPIRDDSGALVGGRCPSCRAAAYIGETFWSALWRCLTGRRRS